MGAPRDDFEYTFYFVCGGVYTYYHRNGRIGNTIRSFPMWEDVESADLDSDTAGFELDFDEPYRHRYLNGEKLHSLYICARMNKQGLTRLDY